MCCRLAGTNVPRTLKYLHLRMPSCLHRCHPLEKCQDELKECQDELEKGTGFPAALKVCTADLDDAYQRLIECEDALSQCE